MHRLWKLARELEQRCTQTGSSSELFNDCTEEMENEACCDYRLPPPVRGELRAALLSRKCQSACSIGGVFSTTQLGAHGSYLPAVRGTLTFLVAIHATFP